MWKEYNMNDRFFVRCLPGNFCNGIYDKEIDRQVKRHSIASILNFMNENHPKELEKLLVHDRIYLDKKDDDYREYEKEESAADEWFCEDEEYATIPWCKDKSDKYPWWRQK